MDLADDAVSASAAAGLEAVLVVDWLVVWLGLLQIDRGEVLRVRGQVDIFIHGLHPGIHTFIHSYIHKKQQHSCIQLHTYIYSYILRAGSEVSELGVGGWFRKGCARRSCLVLENQTMPSFVVNNTHKRKGRLCARMRRAHLPGKRPSIFF